MIFEAEVFSVLHTQKQKHCALCTAGLLHLVINFKRFRRISIRPIRGKLNFTYSTYITGLVTGKEINVNGAKHFVFTNA